MKPGIYPNMGMDDYHALKLDKANLKNGPISCSMLKDFARNPYAWLRSKPKESTPAMNTGSLLDAAITEPDRLDEIVAISPFDSFRTKEAREWKAEQESASRLIIAPESLQNALKCAEAVRSHKEAGRILSQSEAQTGVFGNLYGIPAKALVDLAPKAEHWDETLWDIKSTQAGLDDESVRTSISKWGWWIQAAWYRSLWNLVSPDRHCENFGLILIDPNTREVRVVTMAPDAIILGNRWIKVALKRFVTAAHEGIKSDYASGVTQLDVMPWCAMNEDEWIEKNQ